MASAFSVTDSNRDEIQVKYVDSIISHLVFLVVVSQNTDPLRFCWLTMLLLSLV